MFDAIAPRYDFLNRLLSAGIDARWRRRAVDRALAGMDGATVIDACCGTGDLALEFARDDRVRRVAGFDFAPAMLVRAHQKGRGWSKATFGVGDALHLPARSGCFDVASIAFGLRNLVAPAAGIAELARLLKPAGRLVVLEFFAPRGGWTAATFRAYFRHVVPWIGRWLAGRAPIDAYRYLPESVESFATTDEVEQWFKAAGFEAVKCERLLFGAVALIRGEKRAAPATLSETTRELCLV